MAHLLNTQAMWDFQHAPSRVAGGHPSQHVQRMGDGGPQPNNNPWLNGLSASHVCAYGEFAFCVMACVKSVKNDDFFSQLNHFSD
jgi:hypothetical protein